MKSEYKEGKLYWHEAIDRSHVACDHFYEYVQQHPAVQHDDELEEAATAVTDAMRDFYQLVCRKSDEFDRRNEKTSEISESTETPLLPVERDRFEKWARDKGFHLSRGIHRDYLGSKLNWMWIAWQEAISSRKREEDNSIITKPDDELTQLHKEIVDELAERGLLSE